MLNLIPRLGGTLIRGKNSTEFRGTVPKWFRKVLLLQTYRFLGGKQSLQEFAGPTADVQHGGGTDLLQNCGKLGMSLIG